MKYLIFLLMLSFGLFSFLEDKPTIIKNPYKAYFACSYTDISTLEVSQFTTLIHQPICAKDSLNNIFAVERFEMTYAERGLYQDSTGLPIINTDYSMVSCKGDTIPKLWKDIFMERAYKGDTIYFDKVVVRAPDRKAYQCKTIKLILK